MKNINRLLIAFALLVTCCAHASTRKIEQLVQLADRTQGFELIPELVGPNVAETLPPDTAGYVFRVRTARPAKHYRLRVLRLDDSVTVDVPVLLRDGYLYTRKGDLLVGVCQNCMEGEPLEHFLTGKHGKKCAHARLVPYPIEVSSEQRRISLSLADETGRAFLLCGAGYQPGEKVRVCIDGTGGAEMFSKEAGEDGVIYVLSVVELPSPDGGKMKATFRGSGETLTLDWLWGPQFFQNATVHGVTADYQAYRLLERELDAIRAAPGNHTQGGQRQLALPVDDN